MSPEIITLYFNRGAKVKTFLQDLQNPDRIIYGTIECERTDKPGHYYVRRQDSNLLMSVCWNLIELAE